MKTLLQITALLLIQLTLSAQQIAKSLTASNGTFIGFYEYKPANYNASGPKYPVIIFMHGIGERGNGTTELSRVAANAIPKYIAQGNPMRFTWNGKTETFLVLSPQLSSAWGYWPNFYPEEMIKYAKANLNIDTNRIIVTGLSLGGGGVWQYASASAENGRTAAAIAPVCGTCNMQVAANIAHANLPLWAFHAQNDGTVGVGCTTGQVSQVSAAGTAIQPIMTIYPDGGHGIWDRAFDTVYNWQNPNIYEWFLAQNKSLTPNILPVSNAGSNITISTSKATVNLSGVLSTDADGTIVRYIWTKVSGPAAGTIATPVSSNGLTVINNLTITGTYVYQLKVVDDRASVATSTITVTVTNGVVANIPPVTEAGTDITTASATANLNGSATYDPDGVITAYKWTKLNGPAQYSLSSTTTAAPSLTGLTAGQYSFELEATDNAGASKKDTVVITSSALGLPVKWLYFKGKNNGTVNELQWATSGQLNTEKFEVEKSIDGSRFVKIGEIAGEGTNSIDKFYSFTDNASPAAKTFYRIREISTYGASSFSEVITIRTSDNKISTFEFYPNPALQQVNISIQNKEKSTTTISLFSLDGKLMMQKQVMKETELLQITMDLTKVNPGMYMLQYTIGNSTREMKKIVKQ